MATIINKMRFWVKLEECIFENVLFIYMVETYDPVGICTCIYVKRYINLYMSIPVAARSKA
jgi:hypothetical protein